MSRVGQRYKVFSSLMVEKDSIIEVISDDDSINPYCRLVEGSMTPRYTSFRTKFAFTLAYGERIS